MLHPDHFDNTEENKLVYTELFTQFTEMIGEWGPGRGCDALAWVLRALYCLTFAAY